VVLSYGKQTGISLLFHDCIVLGGAVVIFLILY
jgi:hypothetical protein